MSIGCEVAHPDFVSVWDSQSATVPVWSDSSLAATQFSLTFDVVPSQANEDVVIGLSTNAPSAYTDLAAIIRFNSSGTIDLRSSADYATLASASYAAGVSYHFVMSVNLSTHTYEVTVKPAGGMVVTLGQNYAIRSEGPPRAA